MEQEKQERRTIDVRLLSDAIVELNMSRRSVGLYRRDHPITRGSIERAFGFFEKLFEIRPTITLGITKDTLIVDDHTFDPKNPAFRDFSKAMYNRGIAAIEFRAGMSLEELLLFHELITSKDTGAGKELAELSQQRGLGHVRLFHLDVTKFSFVKDGSREESDESSEETLIVHYVRGLIEGRFPKSEAEAVILALSPEEIAGVMNKEMSDSASGETFDRIATSYLKGEGSSGQRRELFARFVTLAQNLNPRIKEQLLKRSFSAALDSAELEDLLGELTEDDVKSVGRLFSEHPSLIPGSFRSLVDKMSSIKRESGYFDLFADGEAVVDDIILDQAIVKHLSDDKFKDFVSQTYQWELQRMLKGARVQPSAMLENIKKDFKDEHVDRVVTEVMFELLESEYMKKEECLMLLSKLTEIVDDFIETGRFQQISDIYNTLYSHSLSGNFKEETSGMIQYFFNSESFIAKLVNAVRLWGGYDREGVIRLARVLKQRLIDPLLDALSEEQDASVRKLFIHILSTFRSDVLPEAVRRLEDERWYVVRNMIYLLRECGGSKYVDSIRPFAKSGDARISLEAVKTLLQFRDPAGIASVRSYLQDKDPALREKAIELAGSYRIREMVPDLLRLFEKKGILRSDLSLKQSLIKALGNIGDPMSLNSFERFYNSKALLFRSAVGDLKVDLFRSLQNYPDSAARPLLELGLRSRNPEIRTISERLLKNRGS